jgi:hypothetical protein
MPVVRALNLVLLLGALCLGTAARAEAPKRINNDDGPPIQFYTDLSAMEESAVVMSPGKGHIEFEIERKTLRLSWKLTFSDLTSAPTSVTLNGPQTPGANAGVVLNLSPKGVTNPLVGDAIVTDGVLAYLVSDRLYVNLSTAKYKEGELRGQLKRRRPEDVKPRS